MTKIITVTEEEEKALDKYIGEASESSLKKFGLNAHEAKSLGEILKKVGKEKPNTQVVLPKILVVLFFIMLVVNFVMDMATTVLRR